MSAGIGEQKVFFSRRLLQILIALGSLVPIFAGLGGVIWGPQMLDPSNSSSVSLDSHFRYLSGLLLGIGIGFLSTIPHIEKQKMRFRILAMIVVLGGLSRLYGMIMVGTPDRSMFLALGMELLVVPILVLLQAFVIHRRPLYEVKN